MSQRGSVPLGCPHLGLQLHGPGHLDSDHLAINQDSSPKPPHFRFDKLLGWLKELGETLYLCSRVYHKKCHSGRAKWTRRGVGRRALRASVPPLGTPFSQHLDESTNPEVPHTSWFKSLYRIQSPALSIPGGQWVALKFPFL